MSGDKMPSLRAAREHVAGDRIPCLICGKPFRAVCHHARLAHGISARDYKQRFGLPVSRGVATPDSRAAWAASIRKTRSRGLIANGAPPGTPPGAPFDRPAYTHRDLRRIDPVVVDEILRHVYRGLTLTEACQQPRMPKWTWLHQALRRDHVLMAKVDAAIESLPFAQQARMKKLGVRFAAAVTERAGQTALAISRQLGVSEEAVRRQIVRNRAQHAEERR